MTSWLDLVCTGPPVVDSSRILTPCPALPHEEARKYIIDIIITEFLSHDRGLYPHVPDLKETISSNYDPEVSRIAALNEGKRKPPTGRAGSELSRLVLIVKVDLNLYLSPEREAHHQGRSIYSGEYSHPSRRILGNICPSN